VPLGEPRDRRVRDLAGDRQLELRVHPPAGIGGGSDAVVDEGRVEPQRCPLTHLRAEARLDLAALGRAQKDAQRAAAQPLTGAAAALPSSR
jgi:hypothetical protein